MTIKNILVAFNGTEAAKAALRLAIVFARRNDAYLTGLYAHSMPAHYAQMGAYMTAEIAEIVARNEQEAEKKIEEGFWSLLDQEHNRDRASFFSQTRYPTDALSVFARTYDLTVIGQPAEGDWDSYSAPKPDAIALYSGRPVLVAPHGFSATEISRDIIVAWDGNRAASRALGDAIQVLEEGGKITVLHVGDSDADIRQPGRDVMEHLSRHDIHAELLVLPRAGEAIGQVILNAAALAEAGLLVMGAYEHSRFAEAILGGVTKDVLKGVKCPLLISH